MCDWELEDGCWNPGISASPYWNFWKWGIQYYSNLAEMKRQPLWEAEEWPQKCLKVILRRDWHDGSHVAAHQFCGTRVVMPANDSRSGLWQQLLREMMESGETAQWEGRRNTLRRHWSKDSNCDSARRLAKPTGRWTSRETKIRNNVGTWNHGLKPSFPWWSQKNDVLAPDYL